jgi:hypothetical protein
MSDRRDVIAQRRAGNIGGEKGLEESFGRNALEKMGWEDGKGVGKRSKGIAAPLKVKRLREDAGLGRDREEGVTDAWIENVTGFSAVLSKLGTAFNKPDDGEKAVEAEVMPELKSIGVISQKRLRAKNLRSFSREDLTAIMGGIPCETVEKKKPEEGPQETAFGGMFVKAKQS